MEDIIGKNFLFFTQEYLILSVSIIGYIWIRPQAFVKALYLLAFTMIFNMFLKNIFKTPLNPALGEGWAFPSGHMQMAFAFWGWLAWELKNKKFASFVSIVLIGIAYGLWHFNYHSLFDIGGAIFFTFVEFVIFYWMGKLFPAKTLGFILTICSFTLAFCIKPQPLYAWLALGLISGLSLGYSIHSEKIASSLRQKTTAFLCAILGTVLIYYLFRYLPEKKAIFLFIKFFAISFWITYVPSFTCIKRVEE